MQPFRSTRGLHEWSLDSSETSRSSSIEPSTKEWPTPGVIAREVAVTLIVCLGFGLVADLIARTFGAG
jgi:hypothetical protein